ncbi:hypothetical protein SD81_009475 [Tolypothrix campylonemoides VB511288]|nr:hypothetical protein SD81_009475 [Tolypothrix campylonemoides VB511288]
MGKTALATKLAQQIQDEFEYVIWRSLRHAPPLETLLSELKTLATGSDDKTVRLWDVLTGECLVTLHGHTSGVFSVSFSPDGLSLVSGSQDETLKIWNLSTSRCDKTLIIDRLYQGMNITAVTGLTQATIATLKALGAIEN